MKIDTFKKNVMVLLSGTIIAQLIPILAMPVLTRLYTPENFGVFGVFTSLVIMLSIIATGRFELAIFIPKNLKSVGLITKFVILYALVVSMVMFVFVIIFHDFFVKITKIDDGFTLHLIPVGVFIYSLYIVLKSWLNRKEQYAKIRSNLIIQTSAIASVQIVTGMTLFLKNIGLMLGDLLGKLLTVFLILKEFNFNNVKLSPLKAKKIAYRFKSIPLYQIPAALFNNAAIYAPILVLPVIFNLSASGAYFLIFRVVMAPISILGNAILDVFKVEASNAINERGECRQEFLRTLKILAVISSLIFIVIYLFGEPLVVFAFGSEWKLAGELTKALALLAALRFMAAPLSYLFILRERNKVNMLFQIIFLFITLISLYVGYLEQSLLDFAYAFSLQSSVFYCIQLTYSFNLSIKSCA